MRKRQKRRERAYWRNGRAWGDFRDFRDVGGGREPLVVDGERRATTDPDVASLLIAGRLKQLEQARRDRGIQGRISTTLADYIQHHLIQKAIRGARRSARVAGWMLGCAAGLAACGDSTGQDEFPPLAHGTIEGTVTGTDGQPLDSVNVTLVIPASLSERYTIGLPGDLTDSDGGFSLPVQIAAGLPPLPDTVEVYVRASAWPPKYPAPPGEENTRDSVLVATALAPGDDPPPVTDVSIQLTVP